MKLYKIVKKVVQQNEKKSGKETNSKLTTFFLICVTFSDWFVWFLLVHRGVVYLYDLCRQSRRQIVLAAGKKEFAENVQYLFAASVHFCNISFL